MADHVVVGGGHNGLITACYLARAGLDVLVLEQSAKLGGGSRTDELVPGYRFNTHSAAHNIINATGIVDELELCAVGLEYREMDPFSIAVHRDGAIVRFHRRVAQTVESIREVAPADADRYRVWMADTMPIITAMRAGLEAGARRSRLLDQLPARAWAAAQALARNGGPLGLAQLLLSPYGRVLTHRLTSDRIRAPISAFAAHASASPTTPGSAIYGLWQSFYHQVGQWHAVGGAQGLIDALARRLESTGGQWRTDATVAELRATHRSNAVQMLVLLATTALPGMPMVGRGTGTGCSPTSTLLTHWRTVSRKPRPGDCPTTRYRPTPSPPAPSTTHLRRPTTTPFTSRVRRRRSRSGVAGTRSRTSSLNG